MSKDLTNQYGVPISGGSGAIRTLPPPLAATAWEEAVASQTTGSDLDPPELSGKSVADSLDGQDDDMDTKEINRGLPSRNVVVDGKRTSIRLDTYSLDSLYEIAEREQLSINELCTLIYERRGTTGFTLTAAIRVFMLAYYRMSATDEGHRLAGHGRGQPLAGTPFDAPSPVDERPSNSEASSGAGTRPRRNRGPASIPAPANRAPRPLDRAAAIDEAVST